MQSERRTAASAPTQPCHRLYLAVPQLLRVIQQDVKELVAPRPALNPGALHPAGPHRVHPLHHHHPLSLETHLVEYAI